MVIQHNRILIEGTLGTSEVWSTSFATQVEGESIIVDNADLGVWAGLIATDWIQPGNYGTLKTLLTNGAAVTAITCQAYDSAGNLLDQGVPSVLNAPGSTSPSKTYQDAVVISGLGTAPGGRRRGRNYWPALGASLSANRLQSPTAPSAIVIDWRDFVEACCASAPAADPVFPVVVSRTGNFVTAVTQYRCGDVVDTQRRRRDSLLENYVSVNYPG